MGGDRHGVGDRGGDHPVGRGRGLPDAAQAEQIAALADVSTTLFSLDGEPARVHEDDAVPALQVDDDDEGLDEDHAESGGAS